MADPSGAVRSTIAGGAGELAFRIGQAVERLLVQRAVQIAWQKSASGEESVVEVSHLREAIDDSLLKEACTQTGVTFDGEAGPRHSRSAAG